ncbi:MAG: sensor domain-containing diguanylate cyclase [Candidatus Omnitrophica bacterium]|nr:sensor domain-containing diguanylate cyclase [Candidatus Omnitrophota bacterium]
MRGRLKYILYFCIIVVLWGTASYHYKTGMAYFALFTGFLMLLPVSLIAGINLLASEKRTILEGLQGKKKYLSESTDRLKEIIQEKKYLEKKLLDLSNLYIITKEMSFTMRFENLFATLKNFLEDNFSFSKLEIILTKEDDNVSMSYISYEIDGKLKGLIQPPERERSLIDFTIRSKKPVFLEKKKDLSDFGFDESSGNVLSIPLIARSNVIAVMLIEKIGPDDYDRFLILAPQVAMQIDRISLFGNVEKLSITDGLTDAFLRRYFVERAEEEISRARQYKTCLSFIMADLDHFKKYNDTFGHLVGDAILKDVADILKRNVREIDLVARYGGEEFCILLPETDKSGAYIVAERIRKEVEAHTIKAYDETMKITVSMGISCFPEDSETRESLIEDADKALYDAKRCGRNKVCLSG